ncbi:FAD-dependent oxidoreductase [Salinibacterium sp. NSLL150]|uniref:FAD-dependent oxidoreductase n=1 Tax=unclassified Salinibacterium TaxID=2632331 RepID=UPI0018CF4C4C|nr:MULTISPECIES: FAD-dependent oxidoreductase [unclassified Salinibacterium]MBH0100210.1 FAD-dependent oxidoreductase [Salinibacterium sp. NSLL35]MBH0102964.1 FAD-dependent oxidoreductase [Salinibacterium sp. NSLL150]MBH0105724.1 FAD-dependent oxidoreductase [Salinibacterium sp. NSLL16]MBH0108484.1 FAD-dependent oxidoreductase [Salinibacterium sp. NSLL17]MBH0111262.1 FAD-dependent oxidoreductase [Salinibacterium sp. NG22]
MTAAPSPARLLPVVVIGAGPIGLAAAANLNKRGIDTIVLEAGEHAGDAISQWGHVSLFSPWRYSIDPVGRELLEKTDWVSPDPEALPTGSELVHDYLLPLAAASELAPLIRYNSRVIGTSRQGIDSTRTIGRERHPLLVRVDSADGVYDILASAIIDASGTWGHDNPIGASGLPATGETDSAAWLAGPLPDVLGTDRARFAGKHTLVIGMGHSAANALIALAELRESAPGTEITWAIRGRSARRLYGGGTADELPGRGALGTRLKGAVESGAITLLTDFTITELAPQPDGRLRVISSNPDGEQSVTVDALAAATGFRPDLSILRELHLSFDPVLEAPVALAPLIDPNVHSCGTVEPHGASVLAHPEKNVYVVGMKSYGRAPTFLMATGYEQVRSVVAAIAGDTASAGRVNLMLPETGVCCSSSGGGC